MHALSVRCPKEPHAPLPVHVRVRHRRAPRQDLRPDLRRHPRRHPREGPDARASPARRMVKTGMVVVAGEITTTRVGRHARRRPQHDQGDRLHRLVDGLRLRDLRGPHGDREAVARHLAGRDRGRGPPQGAGRRRPGPDVRLRDRRDARPHAGADQLRAQAGEAARRRSARRRRSTGSAPTARPRSRIEYEDDVPVRARRDRRLDAARRRA